MFGFEVFLLLLIRKLVRYTYLLELGKKNTLFKELTPIPSYLCQLRAAQVKEGANKTAGFF